MGTTLLSFHSLDTPVLGSSFNDSPKDDQQLNKEGGSN